jgi:lipoprotein-releasing system permease protein
MVGMGVGAAALVLVLSTFNGFEELAISLYNAFYPDLAVTAQVGKTFTDDTALRTRIAHDPSIAQLSATLEENAYIKYADKGTICTLKGVDDAYTLVTTVHQHIKAGSYLLHDSSYHYAIAGANLAYTLNLDVAHPIYPLQITVPRRGTGTALLPEDAFSVRDAIPSGIFSIQQEFDTRYVLVSLDYAQELLHDEQKVSAYELKLKDGISLTDAKDHIQALVGKGYTVRTRYEQRQTVYRIMELERWAVYAVLTFILMIISFNIVGSLSMLVIEKKTDIAILQALGTTRRQIRSLYLIEGILSAAIGAIIGIAIAVVLALIQMRYGLLKLGGGENSFVIQAYPVSLHLSDCVLAFMTVVVIAAIAAYIPARRAASQDLEALG